MRNRLPGEFNPLTVPHGGNVPLPSRGMGSFLAIATYRRLTSRRRVDGWTGNDARLGRADRRASGAILGPRPRSPEDGGLESSIRVPKLDWVRFIRYVSIP